MIGRLPVELNINGVNKAIRSDFRVALLIFQAYNDPDLQRHERTRVMLECLYEEYESIPIGDIEDAIMQAIWFLDGGSSAEEGTNHNKAKKVMDWEQDEQIIFSAVNKVAGFETRASDYIHWWTFLGYFNEVGEGLFTTVISIRNKLNKGKKLDKVEKEFYKENRTLIDLKTKYSAEQQAEIDRLNKLLNS